MGIFTAILSEYLLVKWSSEICNKHCNISY